jgi:hypothetical protein
MIKREPFHRTHHLRRLSGRAVARTSGGVACLGAALAFATLIASGCTPKPETVLVVNSVSAVDAAGEPVGELYSDVCEGSPSQCVVRPDLALVTMVAQAEDPYTDISHYGEIVVERYRVTYVRSDGRNTPGTDVPYPFDGTVNFMVPVAGPATGQTFMIVRPQAKLESTLRNLAGGGGAMVVSVIAQIDFYGRQVVTGKSVSARGFLNVTFADFAG